MINCPECGKEISDSAPVCPNCGYSFLFAPARKIDAKTSLILFIVGALFCFIVGDKWRLAIMIGGAVIEFIISIILVIATLLLGNRWVKAVLYFLAFDLGFILAMGLCLFI